MVQSRLIQLVLQEMEKEAGQDNGYTPVLKKDEKWSKENEERSNPAR